MGLATTLIIFSILRGRDRATRLLDFERVATNVALSLGREFGIPQEALRSTAAFIGSSQDVTREEFRSFVSGALETYPSIYAIEWMPLVRGDQRERIEAHVRAEGFENFEFREKDENGQPRLAGIRDQYMPLLYMEPLNELALGLDVVGPGTTTGDAQRAWETGRPALSHRFSLVEDPNDLYSIIVYRPVFRTTGPDLHERQGHQGEFLGLVGLIIRLQAASQNALQLFDHSSMQVTLLDLTAPRADQILFTNALAGVEGPTGRGGLHWTRRLRMADREWSIEVTAQSDSPWSAGALPFLVLGVGFLMSGLLAVGVRGMQTITGLRDEVENARELGQYTLGAKLGEGGMGVVYEAQHRMLARPAAIKLIRSNHLASNSASKVGSEALNRFEIEAKATARLRSPHTIDVYDFGRTEAGDFYYVMELLHGLDLESIVRRFGPLEPARTVHVLRQACHSLEEAHRSGLVHRDIKPANIYLCRHGLDYDVVKVLDFGLVKDLTPDDDAVMVTNHDLAIGTPSYMSPEMVVGERDIDGRSDLYSLGCVAYWLLTGSRVFEGDSAVGVAAKQATEVPSPPSRSSEMAISPELDAIVLACLEKDPGLRPQSAAELSARLDELDGLGRWSQEQAQRWWVAHQPTESSGGSTGS